MTLRKHSDRQGERLERIVGDLGHTLDRVDDPNEAGGGVEFIIRDRQGSDRLQVIRDISPEGGNDEFDVLSLKICEAESAIASVPVAVLNWDQFDSADLVELRHDVRPLVTVIQHHGGRMISYENSTLTRELCGNAS